MTSTQMVQAFKFRLDKVDSLNYPDFTNSEVDLLLNQAQERIVKQRYGSTNVKRQSFEETQKRTEDLKAIVTNAILTPIATNSENIDINAQFVILPTNHWFILQERATISYLDCNNQSVTDVVSVYNVLHNDINKIINNSFLQASKNRILRLMEGGKVELIHDATSTLINYKLRYIRKPLDINSVGPLVNCELSEHLHDEIVTEAVNLALEDIESRRFATHSEIEKTNE